VSTNLHPERFDPSSSAGDLIKCEHFARYLWASRIVDGRKVLDAGCGVGYGSSILAQAGATRVVGVDLDADAVTATNAAGDRRVEAVQGDVRQLPFGDGEFDVVVCFETIEHIEEGEVALREFRRVLDPAGLLVVSSPNRGVYPPGNEHHVHEYTPGELVAAVEALFPAVRRIRQHAWVATTLTPSDQPPQALEQIEQLAPDDEIFTLVMGGAELPALEGLCVLGSSFEVRWWQEQLDAATALEHDRAHELERERAARAEIAERLRIASRRLLATEQELASVPMLSARVEELETEIDELRRRDSARELIIEAARADYEASLSWRLTAPLRLAKRRLRG
jgi:SAM-dependent methyltransferase